ncbi:hypothetical protein MCC_03070 [Rickettsia rhipicephali str. 3-7-female6-CWPP]|uniref:Uncharacterized protein n=1 Tax=Rickettsia rhipicephali (strain 3-7-female6-CWPP) TaxID=1105113 RepID=A0AAI8F7E6_RICR3|nr:hypothetical protein MCC_03070 [Rickettsia rhipicephali str. 3-7-female6-CWPP]
MGKCYILQANQKLEYPIGKLQLRNQDSNEAILNTGKINIIRLSYEIYQKTGVILVISTKQ